MPETASAPVHATDDVRLEPLPPELTTIQPGGGYVMQMELAWGGLRRWWLKTFRGGYVRRMETLRKGSRNPAPHPILDPRDAKYYENQPDAYRWEKEDDPFRWRDKIPFARWGLAELLVFSVLTFTPIVAWIVLCFLAPKWYGVVELSDDAPPTPVFLGIWESLYFPTFLVADALAVIGALLVYFFRDPHRDVPAQPGQVVSPADGTVAAVTEYEHHPFIGGPAVKIGIFLSIFNVHVNRFPMTGRVLGLAYKRGKYLNALKPESALENEQLHVRFVTTGDADGPPRRMVIHLIAGLIARRIVCILQPGDLKHRGDRIGMIKLGSRTELVMPKEEGLRVLVTVGQKVHGGATVIAEYALSAVGPERNEQNHRL
jgi:phosphatidylserine decarboxylase